MNNTILNILVILFFIFGCTLIIIAYAPLLAKGNKKSTRLLALICIVVAIGIVIYALSQLVL